MENKKIKIGIITFHCAHNYGAFLQCYALQEHLKFLGFDVNVIDYEPDYLVNRYKVFNFYGFKTFPIIRKIHLVLKNLILCIPNFFRKYTFNKTIKAYINISKFKFSCVQDNLFSDYDAIFFGSDQIWNPKITCGMDKLFWGDFDFFGRKISYAASAGDDFSVFENCLEEVKNQLSNFSAISVREKKFEFFLRNNGIQAETVLDPTFLLASDKWNEFAGETKSTEKYLLLYILRPSKEAPRIARKIAKELNFKIKTIFLRMSRNPKSWFTAFCSPREFVCLFRDAQFIVTTSFHGTSFAINFRKQFYSVNNGNPNLRIESLLEECDLKNRYITSENEINLNQNVEYNDEKINFLKSKSNDFIFKSLNN